jgi:RNA polymerase sigma factor (sigma-70 family)
MTSQEEMFESLVPLAHKRAALWENRYRVSWGDFITFALMGAWDAVLKWDETKSNGASLKSYATHRIDGAIIDEYRRDSPFTRRQMADGTAPTVLSLNATFDEADPRERESKYAEYASCVETGYTQVLTSEYISSILVRFPLGVDGQMSHEEEVIRRNIINEEPLWKIGLDWGVSEGRVCQVKKVAQERARRIAADMDANVALVS